ncbi:MAG: hypothetical protein AAFQ57_16275 [Cyanobacteria bacterium J06626_14]
MPISTLINPLRIHRELFDITPWSDTTVQALIVLQMDVWIDCMAIAQWVNSITMVCASTSRKGI